MGEGLSSAAASPRPDAPIGRRPPTFDSPTQFQPPVLSTLSLQNCGTCDIDVYSISLCYDGAGRQARPPTHLRNHHPHQHNPHLAPRRLSVCRPRTRRSPPGCPSWADTHPSLPWVNLETRLMRSSAESGTNRRAALRLQSAPLSPTPLASSMLASCFVMSPQWCVCVCVVLCCDRSLRACGRR